VLFDERSERAYALNMMIENTRDGLSQAKTHICEVEEL